MIPVLKFIGREVARLPLTRPWRARTHDGGAQILAETPRAREQPIVSMQALPVSARWRRILIATQQAVARLVL